MKSYLISALILMTSSQVLAQGKTLHDANCLQCHASITGGKANSIYSRADHKIKTLAALEKQVSNCAVAADANWSETQREAVVNYLSETFYHF
jgi:mono/diheme cytochrome c family protein